MALKLYSMNRSGHAHTARNLLSLLDVDCDIVEVDIRNRGARGQHFTELNRFQQVPVLDDGGFVVRDSHAILFYLAKKYDPKKTWLPEDTEGATRVQEWLATSTLDLVIGPAWARAALQFARPIDAEAAKKRSHRLFERIDQHLASCEWLATSHPTIADVSMYPYVRLSPEGGLDYSAYGNLCAWLDRLEALPRFVLAPLMQS